MAHVIMVGVDGSADALRAVDWAAVQAARRGWRLHIVHAVARQLFEPLPAPRFAEIRTWMRNTGDEVLEEARAHAVRRAPGIPTSTELVPDPPARGLLEASASSGLLVVGGHGSGRVAGLLLGSVALQVATHAVVPVVVVRGEDVAAAPAVGPPGRREEVVVGVDGSPASLAATDFAFEEAASSGALLRAVRAWTDLRGGGHAPVPPARDRDASIAEERRALAALLAEPRKAHPRVEVVEEVVHGRAARVLIEASTRARLVVVGHRGLGGFAGLLLGSVAHAVLHRARCPVAIVRLPKAAEP